MQAGEDRTPGLYVGEPNAANRRHLRLDLDRE